MSTGNAPLLAQQRVFDLDDQLALLRAAMRAASVTSATLPRTKCMPSSSSR